MKSVSEEIIGLARKVGQLEEAITAVLKILRRMEKGDSVTMGQIREWLDRYGGER